MAFCFLWEASGLDSLLLSDTCELGEFLNSGDSGDPFTF